MRKASEGHETEARGPKGHMSELLAELDPARPVLIYGPTASGKSELALRIAEAQGGVVVNADASQAYENWRVLTARPGPADLSRAPHALYGHLPWDAPYSAGAWLRDVAPLLNAQTRPIIVGGTGLYFAALTEGLVDMPPTPPALRTEADNRLAKEGLAALVAELDPPTRDKIDLHNPMRVQRAWEVLHATGRGLAAWHAETAPPLLPLSKAQGFTLTSDTDWLTARISRRFEAMLDQGALDEARTNLDRWDPALGSMKAIGARDLMDHLEGLISRDEAAARVTISTRQYAKRQRTWGRARMRLWRPVRIDRFAG